MNIALMSHDHKKELMVQFCTAYCGVLSKHTVCATNTTGRMVAEATGLPVNLFLSHAHGGSQQIGARIAYNEIDMVLFFSDPQSSDLDPDLKYINQMCDQYNIPFATNAATAEILIHGLERGDLDWRDIVHPQSFVQVSPNASSFRPGTKTHFSSHHNIGGHTHGTHQTPDVIRFYGTAACPADAV